MALQKHVRELGIPLDRQKPADYLDLELEDMQKGPGQMKREGLSGSGKNDFSLPGEKGS